MTLLFAALALASNLLVLRSGERIVLSGPPTAERDRITFRTPDGQLFTMPLSEVDVDATAAAAEHAEPGAAATKANARAVIPLKVSEAERKRLLAELEQNHSGTDAAPVPPAPRAEVRSRQTEVEDEWSWRNRARAMDEAVRQAEENRDLLTTRRDALRDHITSLLSLGYKPSQFTWDVSQLQQVTDQIPEAELAITRALRARDQFRDEARRRGILPGWLR